jgi:hypothetical protein
MPEYDHDHDFISDLPRYLVTRIGRLGSNHKRESLHEAATTWRLATMARSRRSQKFPVPLFLCSIFLLALVSTHLLCLCFRFPICFSAFSKDCMITPVPLFLPRGEVAGRNHQGMGEPSGCWRTNFSSRVTLFRDLDGDGWREARRRAATFNAHVFVVADSISLRSL